ncbi:hypothetical protein BC826DRAFT_1106696 [Russula brevipes]|nr:hypothetical protein BC826DRAFT_1106696 [Russula brevipes]
MHPAQTPPRTENSYRTQPYAANGSRPLNTPKSPPSAETSQLVPSPHLPPLSSSSIGKVPLCPLKQEPPATSVEMTKSTIPAFAVGPDGLFAGTITKSDSDRDAEKGQVSEQEEMEEACPAFIQEGRATTATREETPSQPTVSNPPKILTNL